jgi:hypothetical protein
MLSKVRELLIEMKLSLAPSGWHKAAIGSCLTTILIGSYNVITLHRKLPLAVLFYTMLSSLPLAVMFTLLKSAASSSDKLTPLTATTENFI